MYLVHAEEFDDFESASEFREQWKEAKVSMIFMSYHIITRIFMSMILI